jgi:hypothetical protein
MDSLRLTGKVRVDRTHHDASVIGHQAVERNEMLPVQRQHGPLFRSREFQNLAIGREKFSLA